MGGTGRVEGEVSVIMFYNFVVVAVLSNPSCTTCAACIFLKV